MLTPLLGGSVPPFVHPVAVIRGLNGAPDLCRVAKQAVQGGQKGVPAVVVWLLFGPLLLCLPEKTHTHRRSTGTP